MNLQEVEFNLKAPQPNNNGPLNKNGHTLEMDTKRSLYN